MTRPTTIADALGEAARWRLAALLLERPRAGWLDELRALAREVDDAALGAAVDAAPDATEGDYLALLGPGGAVPAREVGYRAGRDPGWLLSDVARFYDAFAYRPRAEDPADHFAVEVGFVGYLWLKEALARSRGDGEAADVTAEARRVFVDEHLAGVAQAFARTLVAAGDASHLASAAAVVAKLVPAGPWTPVPAEDADEEGCAAAGCPGRSPAPHARDA
jgi:hypothetical protein